MLAEVRRPLDSIVLNNQNKSTNSCINNNVNCSANIARGVGTARGKVGGGMAMQVCNKTANVSNIEKKNFPLLSLNQSVAKRRRQPLNLNTKEMHANEKNFDLRADGTLGNVNTCKLDEKNTNKKMKSTDIRNYICVNNYNPAEFIIEKENVNLNNIQPSYIENTAQEKTNEINSFHSRFDKENKQNNQQNSACMKEVMNKEMNELNNKEEKSNKINQLKMQKSNLAKIYPPMSSFPALSTYSSLMNSSSMPICFSKSNNFFFSNSSLFTNFVNKKINVKEEKVNNSKETQKEDVLDKESMKEKMKLTIQCAMINFDRSSVYTPDFGFDNSHNNFWSNTSYEQQAAIADEKHAENYIKDSPVISSLTNSSFLFSCSCSFLFLSESSRSRILSHLSILSDAILKNRKSVDVFSIACTIFDRYMSLQKKELLEILYDRSYTEGKKKNMVNLSIKNVNNNTNNVNNSILYFIKKYNKNIEVYYEIIALSCYCIAIKHDAIEPSTPEYILNVWKDVLKNTNFFAPWRFSNNTAELNSRKKDLILIEFRILNSLLSNVALPTATIMVEGILNPRSERTRNKNLSENIDCNKTEVINVLHNDSRQYCRTSIEKYNSMSTECQILLRLSMLNTNIFLNYKPSVQTYACASLCNQTYNYIKKMQKKEISKDNNAHAEDIVCECKNDAFIKSVRSSGIISVDEDIIESCKKEMMHFFLFIFNLQKIFYSKNISYNNNCNLAANYVSNSFDTIKQKYSHFRPICEWLRSLQADSQIRNLILHMKVRYANCLSKCNNNNKNKSLNTVEKKMEEGANNNLFDVNNNYSLETKNCSSLGLSFLSPLYSVKNSRANEIKQIVVK